MDEALLPVDLQIPMALLRLGERGNDKLAVEKLTALFRVGGIVRGYASEFKIEKLLRSICAKKIAFILEATTKKEIEEILQPPKNHYNGNEVIPSGRFHIPEEELLMWSYTSLRAGGPLNDAGFKRYMKLFRELLPEYAQIIE